MILHVTLYCTMYHMIHVYVHCIHAFNIRISVEMYNEAQSFLRWATPERCGQFTELTLHNVQAIIVAGTTYVYELWYTHVYIYIYIYMYVCTYVCMHACMYVQIYILCTCIHMCVCIHTRIPMEYTAPICTKSEHIQSKPSFVVPIITWCCAPKVLNSAAPPAMQNGEPGSPETSA